MQAGLSERGQQSWPDTRRVVNKTTEKMSKGAGSNITMLLVSIQKKPPPEPKIGSAVA